MLHSSLLPVCVCAQGGFFLLATLFIPLGIRFFFTNCDWISYVLFHMSRAFLGFVRMMYGIHGCRHLD
ncbi:hypothetical protein J3E72DRAFT_327382 [Bipolaris maydis]|uniref:uncharacterized protein n=1 Tax=Cochliobolus heterostrophus TaxID=5016 RepID=UPI0024D2DB9C|nr:hypothetical protein J3E73DRAFT_319397 [Bipolaris maydis]KAJ5064237.1 hypothetical protein J3E74DRAFT_310932 [Bipolaris maydis]KAJ6196615.1 hypothetical protein J3E72DRAFT_327382 [Bipolaris maydis]KAJ6207501.1 hypothetical protein PSV09DRAFT_2322406 [Bipolaris maydis]KAJ6269847.1 hypothetical protein PSV08DRAFT_310340 [Bipolaris maydis]